MEGAWREWARRFFNTLLPMQKILCGALATALCSMAAAQGGISLYVSSSTGSDTANGAGAAPTNPLLTLQAAVTIANGYGATPVTIYLDAQGAYTAPASMRTSAVSVIGYQGVSGQRPKISGTIVVDDASVASAYPARFENLTLENVRLPAGGAVEFRRCTFDFGAAIPTSNVATNTAIAVDRPDGTVSNHVVEHCDFTPTDGGTNRNVGIQNFGTGPVAPEGQSSLLIRANRFSNVFFPILMQSDSGDNCYPRVVSNTFSQAQRVAYFEHCIPFFVNNSIDQYRAHGTGYDGSAEAYGVKMETCPSEEVSNNIIWFVNPAVAAGTVDDILPSVPTGSRLTNYLSDSPGAVLPYDATAGFPVLSPSSILAVSGTVSIVQPGATVTTPNGAVPLDVPIDYEGDMRIVRSVLDATPTIAIGADQPTDLGISVIPSAATDGLGNWYGTAAGANLQFSSFALDAQGLISGTSAEPGITILIGSTLAQPAPSTPSALLQHAFPEAFGLPQLWGSLTTIPQQPLNLGYPIYGAVVGTTSATISVPAMAVSTAFLGETLYLQLLSTDYALTTGLASNRLGMRLNLDPGYTLP